MTSFSRRLRLPVLIGCLSALLLAGCSTTRVVESNVDSYSSLAALPSPPTYRLERLPSQNANAVRVDAIESQAQQALSRVGLERNDSNPSLVLQLGAEAGRVPNPYWDYGYSGYPYYGPRPFWGFGSFGFGRGWGLGLGMGWMMDRPTPLYHRKVSLVLREAKTQKIVYESSAVYQDVWTNDPAIFGVLFDQALAGFPVPPRGARVLKTRVDAQTATPLPPEPAQGTAPAPATR